MDIITDIYTQMNNHTRERGVLQTEGAYLKQCKEVDGWLLMSSPWPILTIIVGYLIFVIKVGPEYMKDRKPINIKPIILFYNLYQTLYNFFIVQRLFTTPGAVNYLWTHGCHPMDPNINPYLSALNETAWYFFFSKVMDLLDTIFFVLRKKNSHITFLHVYHHSNMVLATWGYLKYIKGEQGAIVGWMNSLVHTAMYAYYFLSALGPHMQKYLWWKKYITKMQMIQFVLIIMYMLSLLIGKCDLPKSFSCFVIFQGVTFLLLFINFYWNTYNRPKDKPYHRVNTLTNGVSCNNINNHTKEATVYSEDNKCVNDNDINSNSVKFVNSTPNKQHSGKYD